MNRYPDSRATKRRARRGMRVPQRVARQRGCPPYRSTMRNGKWRGFERCPKTWKPSPIPEALVASLLGDHSPPRPLPRLNLLSPCARSPYRASAVAGRLASPRCVLVSEGAIFLESFSHDPLRAEEILEGSIDWAVQGAREGWLHRSLPPCLDRRVGGRLPSHRVSRRRKTGRYVRREAFPQPVRATYSSPCPEQCF